MMIAFVYIPCSIGALCCLAIARWLPRFRMSLLGGTAAVALVLAGYAIWSVVAGDRSDLLTERWFHHTLNRLSFTSSYLLPSWWLSSGLLQAARAGSSIDGAGFTQSLWFLALLVSNAMLGQVATHALGSRVLRASYSRLHTGPSGGTHRGGTWIDRFTMAVTFPLPHQVRLLILKDLRVFRRDPVQWAQFLIFFGLLGLYFLNIRRVTYDVDHTLWVNMISFLNLAVVGLILSTFTTRFIFPMISLEGSRFWILGLLPIKRDTILWGKFLFAAVGAAVPSTILILISDLMLRVAPLVVVVHQITCLLLCAGLSGLAVGMGAMMPNLREQSPSKIAAGFGGTLNLVLSALYIVVVVALTAVPCHFYLAAQPAGVPLPEEINARLIHGIWISTALAIGVGILTTFVPLYRGLRAFRRLQF
jgi:ABC-2 type transport system permease protein